MTITQTVDIPADYRLFLDLPRSVPAGARAQVEITIPSVSIPPVSKIEDVRQLLQKEMAEKGTSAVIAAVGNGWEAHVREHYGESWYQLPVALASGDVPEQTALVTAFIDSGESFAVADVALIETVFVLEKLKKISRETIEKAIMAIIEKDTIVCNRELFIEALARKTENSPLLTFDQKLAKQLSGAQLLSS